jgi:hypothetical protein
MVTASRAARRDDIELLRDDPEQDHREREQCCEREVADLTAV